MESWIRRAEGEICPDDTLAMPKLLSYAVCATSPAASQLTRYSDLRCRLSADAWLSLHSPAQGSNPKFRIWKKYVLILEIPAKVDKN